MKKKMKKSILILGCFLISCIAFGYTPIESNTKKTTEISISSDVYPAVASTENSYGQNYSIGIEIHGQRTAYGGRIDKVVCSGSSVSYMPVYGANNKYSISYDGTTYYFTF
tara:strand:+ start:28 stop:360 length:333 start_codon:yes stop_codon:yes gene_type:complete